MTPDNRELHKKLKAAGKLDLALKIAALPLWNSLVEMRERGVDYIMAMEDIAPKQLPNLRVAARQVLREGASPSRFHHPRACPKCGSERVRRIVYGYPSPELRQEAEEGKVILGGCCIGPRMPQWACLDCDYGQRREED